jgi:hypothetical protein
MTNGDASAGHAGNDGKGCDDSIIRPVHKLADVLARDLRWRQSCVSVSSVDNAALVVLAVQSVSHDY